MSDTDQAQPGQAAHFGLTRAQYECLCIIQELQEAFGRPPSLDEICHEMSLANRGAVARLLGLLRERGRVNWLPNRARSLAVLAPVPLPEDFEFVVTVR